MAQLLDYLLKILLGTALASTLNFHGFASVNNNLQDGNETGSPVVFAVPMEGNGTQIYLEDGADNRSVSGSAPILTNGASLPFSDLHSLSQNGILTGWLKFNQNVPSTDCFGQSDCHPAKWNKKTNGNGGEGYLSGWAKMEIGPNLSEVWVHFKSPADPNNHFCGPNLIQRDQNYYVCSTSTGELYGYAWSSGASSSTIADNPGLGWIDFSKASIDFSGLSEPEPNSNSNSNINSNLNSNGNFNGNVNNNGNNNSTGVNQGSCYVYLDSGSPSETICGTQGAANYRVFIQGELSPVSYEWRCREGAIPEISNSPVKECSYSGTDTYVPRLTVVDASGAREECQPMTSVLLTTEVKCQVKARKAGEEGFSTKISLLTNDQLEAKLFGQCIERGTTFWKAPNLTVTYSNNDILQAFAARSGKTKISASVLLNDGREIKCSDADLEVKEKVRIGF